MKKSVLEIKRARRVKDRAASAGEALVEYEAKQAALRKLLKQIEAGLDNHDRDASTAGGHNWGHVGDLGNRIETLIDIRDRLYQTGEYGKAATWL